MSDNVDEPDDAEVARRKEVRRVEKEHRTDRFSDTELNAGNREDDRAENKKNREDDREEMLGLFRDDKDVVKRVAEEIDVARIEDRAADKEERDSKAKKIAKERQRRSLSRLLAFLLIVAIAIVGFWQVQKQRDQDHARQEAFNKDRCVASRDNRILQHDIINAIVALNKSFIDPKKKYTTAEQAQIKTFLKNIEIFKRDAEKKLVTSKSCDKYNIPEIPVTKKAGVSIGN